MLTLLQLSYLGSTLMVDFNATQAGVTLSSSSSAAPRLLLNGNQALVLGTRIQLPRAPFFIQAAGMVDA